jgi:hypothetical protein
MEKISLNHELSINAEYCGDSITRLIILKNNEEWICRKERLSKLFTFLHGPDTQIFKGRLRLHKQDEIIHVEVKGIRVGIIRVKSFLDMITDRSAWFATDRAATK